MERLCPTCEHQTLGQRKGQTDKEHEDVAEIRSFTTVILHTENQCQDMVQHMPIISETNSITKKPRNFSLKQYLLLKRKQNIMFNM